MRIPILLLLSLVTVVWSVSSPHSSSDSDDDGSKIDISTTQYPLLDEDTFETKKASGLWFINFYSPVCSHCIHFEPTWKKLVQYFLDNREAYVGLHLGAVDCLNHMHVCTKEHVTATPTMKLYSDGEYESHFDGDRGFQKIKKFIKKHYKFYMASKNQGQTQEDPNDKAIQPLRRVLETATKREMVNPNGQIVDLTNANYENSLKFGPWIVEFYDQWCGHCQAFAPVYKDFAKEMKGTLNVARMNGPVETTLTNKMGVHAYPTVLFLRNGEKVLEYTGQRTLGSLVEFGKHVGQFDIPFSTRAQVDQMSAETPVFALLLFNGETTEKVVRTFAKVAEEIYYHVPFYVSTSHEILPSFSRPSVLVLRKSDPWSPHVYSGDITSRQDMRDFITKTRYAFVQELNSFNIPDLLQTQILIVGLLNPLIHTNEMNVLNDISKDIRSRFREFGGLSTKHTSTKTGPEDRDVKTVYFNSATWNGYARDFFGKEHTKVPSISIVRYEEGIYYDADEEGKPFEWGKTSVLIQIENLVKEIKENRPSPLQAKTIPGRGRILKGFFTWKTVIVLCLLMGIIYYALQYLNSSTTESRSRSKSVAASYVKLAKSAGIKRTASQAYSARKFE